MANGFFREQKHYKLSDISDNLGVTSTEAKRLTGILKKYGIVKAVNASKPEYEDLSNKDIVLTDTMEDDIGVEYVFDFVGVVMADEYVFKCYPKYIRSSTEPLMQLKKVLKVIKKYNNRKQPVYLYNGGDDNRIFNSLAVSLYLLEDYYNYGIYTNRHDVVETNGDGEILWERTINETFAFIQNGMPHYMELQTRNTVEDDSDYIKRLHECVLSQCTAKLKEAGILELFDIGGVEPASSVLRDFGDKDYIKYRLEREMRLQYITRKQTLLRTLYIYVDNDNAGQENSGFSLYGTNSFNLVWQNVCAANFGSVLKCKIRELPSGVSPEYEDMKDCTLEGIIDAPVWRQNSPHAKDGKVRTLQPDIICVYPVGDGDGGSGKEYCFGIYDAKYYLIDFINKKGGWKVSGQPGVEDVAKQYLYQLAFGDFIEKQGYKYVQNVFICPKETAEPDYGSVRMNMMRKMGNGNLRDIAVVKLCAEEMYDIYLAGKEIDDIPAYIPKTW